jgi:glutathione synthase/RimK-type ligase-like ATP-grasp enzyme
MTATVAYVTCAAIPDLEPDDLLTTGPLAALDISVEPAIWDDPSADWNRFDLVVLRSPWDYTPRRDAFVAWAHSVPRLVNDAAMVDWNTDKRYLAELAAAGVAVVPTTYVAPGETWTQPAGGEWVIKPAISAGSRDTGRYDGSQRALAAAHIERLNAAGRVTMIQPYLSAVDTYGETALIFIGGVYSHAIRKGPLLSGPDAGLGERLYVAETITPREPTPAERALADQVMRALPARITPPLYARIDLVPGPNGEPLLIELELTEPSLFFEHGPGSPVRFAAACRALVPDRS